MFTDNINDFYNFAANRVLLRHADFVTKYFTFNGTGSWSKTINYVKSYCENSVSVIESIIEKIKECKNNDEKYEIYDELYWFIFDEDDFEQDFTTNINFNPRRF